MTTPAHPLFVPAPALVRPRFGLLQAATIMGLPDDPHWQMGVTWEGPKCGPAQITNGLICDDVSEDPFNVPKNTDRGVPLYTGSPFVVYGDYECSVIGRPISEARERAVANLLAGEGRAVERAFQLGEAGNEPSLVGSATDITPGAGGLSIVEAIAIVEQYGYAEMPGLPVLHMTPYLATYAANERLLHAEMVNGEWLLHTALGTPVVVGGGYAEAGPGNESPSSPGTDGRWIYVTSQVFVWRGEPWVTPPEIGASVDRAFNNITVLAERTYVIGMECAPAAVRVDL